MEDEQGQGANIIVLGGLAGGLSSLVIFKELMARVYAAGGRQQIRELFNMMAGTGTGALVGSVFSEKKLIGVSGSGTFKASKLEEELKLMVREATGDEDTLIMKTQHEVDCKVMVFAMSEHNMNASTPRIFRSYQSPNNQMPNCPIWQVLRATMAHPELFKSFQVGDGSAIAEPLLGGDIACSNPTPHVLTEFSALYPELRVASIVCIGAGHARTIQIPKSSPLHRIMPTNVLMAMKDIATDSERVAQEMAARFQDTSDVYFRFSVDQGMQDARMSRWQNKSQVAAHTRTYMQKAEVNEQIDKAARTVAASKGVLVGAVVGRMMQQKAVQQKAGGNLQYTNYLASMTDLASTYRDQGRWEEAETLQVEALDATKQALGELHPDTLTNMANLASIYRAQGRWDEAEVLQVQVLDARGRALGRPHPNTLTRDQSRLNGAEMLRVYLVAVCHVNSGNRINDLYTATMWRHLTA
ncbi:hypothetical protein FRC09_004207 [Ceratobasidium sp. 395]|nr:hypothetical protein FRC09_004207 [Ceratobasidium sp. 395]